MLARITLEKKEQHFCMLYFSLHMDRDFKREKCIKNI